MTEQHQRKRYPNGTYRVGVILPSDVADEIIAWAEADHRSISSLASKILIDYFRDRAAKKKAETQEE